MVFWFVKVDSTGTVPSCAISQQGSAWCFEGAVSGLGCYSLRHCSVTIQLCHNFGMASLLSRGLCNTAATSWPREHTMGSTCHLKFPVMQTGSLANGFAPPDFLKFLAALAAGMPPHL